ncbi:hypothetical protein B0H13DRAFT_1890598 [Mycena leptocephala]|nr:hypothetical protein B0H13DRAFT_1890598 [Mycena leptocephala]
MHLKPLPEDYDLEGEDLISTFAWNSAFWRLDISLIPHIRTLILTTPSYVIWPPTTSQFKLTIAEWTAQFRHKTESQLNEIIINFAFNDEGVLVEKWAEETGKEVGDVYEDKRAVGGGYGTQIVLCPNSKKKKTWDSVTIFHSSKSNREEYFFGREGRDYMYPWLYLDEVKAAKKWRKSQSDFSGVPGNFVHYALSSGENRCLAVLAFKKGGIPPLQNLVLCVAAGWVPAIYTNSQLADDQIRGFANFVRESYATKEQALKAWNTFCQNHHGNRCPNAARTFWGIKGLTAMFESRDEAIQFADSVGLMTINLFGSTDENEVRSFVRLPMA